MNALKGETTVEIDGASISLVLDNSAWCQIEDVLDLSYLDILKKLFVGELTGRSPKNSMTRAILWGATRAHHSEMTIEQCGDAIMRQPGLHQPLSEIIRASTQSLEPPVESDDASGEATPPKTAAKRKKSPSAN